MPVGDYTRQVLPRLPPAAGGRILANVRSTEPDVKGVVGKLTQDAVDAGFVYRTDVVASGGALRGDRPARALEPTVAYGAAVVTGASSPARRGVRRRTRRRLLRGRAAPRRLRAPPPA